MDLTGKRALVTGASRNLGVTIAERLARGGMSVAVNYRTTRDPAEQLAADLREHTGRLHVAVAGDVSDADSVAQMVETASSELGGTIDVLVNNAGPYGMTPFVEMDEAEWDTVWDANVKSTYLVTRAVVPEMREAGWGRIVNMSAVSAWVRNRSIYGLAKAAILTLTEELAVELAPEITVNAIAPGQVLESLDDLGDFSQEWAEEVTARTPAGRLVTRAELAEIVHLLCTPAFDMVTGLTIPVDGGLRLPQILMAATTEEVLDRLYAAFFAGDPTGMTALMHPDVDVRFLGQARLDGLEEARRFFAFSGPLLDDLDFRIRRRVVDGEWAAVVWDETATVTATGARWENHGVDVFHVEDGLITALHENNDCRLVHAHLPRYSPDEE